MELNQELVTQKVGEIIKPVVPDGTVEEILKQVYGLQAECITLLNSYDDCNYAIRVKSDYDNKYIPELSPHGYLMKIINTMDSKRPIMHEAQHCVMDHLRSQGIPTQEPVPSKNGEYINQHKIYAEKDKIGDHATHIVRLMTFLPGEVLLKYPLTPSVLYQDGVFVAKMTLAFQNFQHDFFNTFDTKWSFDYVPTLREYLYVLKPEDKTVVEEVIGAFENKVVPLVAKFPKGYIHGDPNESNLLVMQQGGQENVTKKTKQLEFTGVIDFQDTAYSCKIYDLAINIAYLMIFTDTKDQLDAPGHILAGYSTKRQLTDEEVKSLKTLFAARLCQSLVYGEHAFHVDPSDAYVLHTAKRGWALLHKFWAEPEEKLQNRWQFIMDGYKDKH